MFTLRLFSNTSLPFDVVFDAKCLTAAISYILLQSWIYDKLMAQIYPFRFDLVGELFDGSWKLHACPVVALRRLYTVMILPTSFSVG